MYVCVRVHADISMCPHSGKGKQKWCGLLSFMAQGKQVVCVHIRLKVWSALVDGFEANKSSMCPHSAQGKKTRCGSHSSMGQGKTSVVCVHIRLKVVWFTLVDAFKAKLKWYVHGAKTCDKLTMSNPWSP